jgi:hypothetical protein
MRKALVAMIVAALTCALATPSHAATKVVKGPHGQVLRASATSVKSGAIITVNGKYFDETVGIYLGFCVVPKAGESPTPCGGGINKDGSGDSSLWISSNPPPYGVGLAEEFMPGGRFTKKLTISKMIGKFDCKKVKCAITVRADHMRSEDRSFDLFIPISIKK